MRSSAWLRGLQGWTAGRDGATLRRKVDPIPPRASPVRAVPHKRGADSEGDRPRQVRPCRGPRAAGPGPAGDRERRGAGQGAGRRCRPRRLARHDRAAVPAAAGGLRVPGAEEPGTRPGAGGGGRAGRRRRDPVPARRRGVRRRGGQLRRVRACSRGQAGGQAREPHLRAGCRLGHLRPDGAAGGAGPRRRSVGPAGAGHRRLGRCGDVRGAARLGVRRRGHRRVQQQQGGPGPLARRRPRHRLHPRTTSRRHHRATTSSSTSGGTRRCPGSGARSPRTGPWSSSAARPTAGGSVAPTAR